MPNAKKWNFYIYILFSLGNGKPLRNKCYFTQKNLQTNVEFENLFCYTFMNMYLFILQFNIQTGPIIFYKRLFSVQNFFFFYIINLNYFSFICFSLLSPLLISVFKFTHAFYIKNRKLKFVFCFFFFVLFFSKFDSNSRKCECGNQ